MGSKTEDMTAVRRAPAREKAKTSWSRWDEEELQRELLPWPDTIQITLTEADVKLMRRLTFMLHSFHIHFHRPDCICQDELLKEAVTRLRELTDIWVSALEGQSENS